MATSDELMSRRVIDPGVPAPGTEQNYVQDVREAVAPGSQAASTWNQNLDGAAEYLTSTGLVWRALHLSLLNGVETVSIIYEPGGYFTGGITDEYEVTKQLRPQYFPPEVFPNLELVEAKVSKGTIVLASEYEKTRCIGKSIGVAGVIWSAGTAGGFLASNSNSDEVFGLSCHHVLLPTKYIEIAQKEKEEKKDPWEFSPPEFLEVTGIQHESYNNDHEDVVIMQPACGDHRDTLQEAQKEKTNGEGRLSDLFEKHKLLGSTPPKASIDRQRRQVEDMEECLDRYSKSKREFGKLAYTSGYRIDKATQHTLDWGLFRLTDGSLADNTMPRLPHRPGWEALGGLGIALITGIADPVEKEAVFKRGRSSGPTYGEISGVRDQVRFSEHGGCESKEWCVVKRRIHEGGRFW
ncbi:hypothetical protein H072_1039 [Dactylellina haptotyla CBS 200.50]|uniref:Uncharacterized protein n=1 Tax=Dactylellina haptotyla (strain CBS 200.50) TaxID=1284197 RepID=S8AVP9_DACHA|nr:hypothetical protein H072_1039 [Dactylellina haptotyla CBS 200.50]